MAWLPETLPAKPELVWSYPLRGDGMAGVSADRELVVVADRTANDTTDVFHALQASTGKVLWSLRYPAPGKLDYGNSPRANPLLVDDAVVTLGAFGHLHVLERSTGAIRWSANLRARFRVDDELVWGVCSSPIVVDGALIVNPGGKSASLVALDLKDGAEVWRSLADRSAFASFLLADVAGKRQLIGYDATTLGGWDPKTGKRLWSITPKEKKDFNVPTPMVWRNHLFVTTENNGSRLYRFNAAGVPADPPIAQNDDLAPDTSSPVIVGDRVFGVWNGLHCLDLKQNLKKIWTADEEGLGAYASLIASPERLLLTTVEGELILVDARADAMKILSRLKVFSNDQGVYSHPAIVGNHLYLRGSTKIVCLKLGD